MAAQEAREAREAREAPGEGGHLDRAAATAEPAILAWRDRAAAGETAVLGSGALAVPVASLDQAIRFYCGALGLELRLRVGDHWAEVECDGARLCLVAADPGLAGRAALSLRVRTGRLAAVLGRLRRAGMTASTRTDGAGRSAQVADPDGNDIFLVELRRGPGAPPPIGRVRTGTAMAR